MARFLRTTTNSSRGHSRLIPPAVVNIPAPFVARPVVVRLANQRAISVSTRRPSSGLGTPVVIGPSIAFHGPGVRLADPLSANSLNRRKAKSFLRAPVVVTTPAQFVASPVQVELAPSTRKSRAAHPNLPKIVYSARVYAPIAGYLTKPRDTSPATHPRLQPPAVVTQIVAELARPITTHLAYSKRGKPLSGLGAPKVLLANDAFPQGPMVQYAPSSRGKAKSFLRAPVVVTSVATELARPISRTFVRIRPFPTDASVFKPAVIQQAQGPQGGVGIQLAPSFRGKPKSFLRAPVVATAIQTEVFGGPTVTLAPQKRGKPKSFLRPMGSPAVTYAPVVVRVAPQKRGAPKSLLRRPAVVASVLARALAVKLVRIRPRRTVVRLRPPVVVAPVLARPINEELVVNIVKSERPRTMSRLGGPVVVFPFFSRKTVVTLVRIRPRRTVSFLRPPADLVDRDDLGFVRVRLARITTPSVHSILRKPVVIDLRPQAYYLDLHLAYSSRGEPKARLAPPVVVAPVLAPPVHVTLARIKPAAIHSVLRRPTDLVDAQDVGFARVHLAYSRRGAPKSVLHAPTVVAPVLARPILTHLVRIAPAPVHSVLRRPVDLVDAADLGFVRAHLTYSLRGKPKSRLSVPTVVAPVLATPIVVALSYSLHGAPKSRLFAPAVVAAFVEAVARPIDETLAYSLRGKPKSTLRPPAVVAPVLASPIGTTLVRIRPVATRWRLRRPVDLVDRDDLGSVRVTLAYGLRGKAKPRLAPPTVVAPVLARRVDVTLVRIRPVRTTATLRRPVDLVDQQDVGSLRAHLAYSLRGKPKSRLVPPSVVAPVLARPVFVSLAPSFRGTPKSHLAAPTVVAPVLARPIDTTLARITPALVHSVLRRPVDLVDQQDLGFVRVHLVRIRPVPVHAVLGKPVVIDLTPQTYYLDLHLAYSRRGAPKSLLRQASLFTPQPKAETVLAATLTYSVRGKPKSLLRRPVVVTAATPYLRPIYVTLAPQRRGKPKPFLRRPVVVRSFIARRALIELAPSRFPRPKSVLRKPVVVQAFRIPVISTTLVRITPPPVHSVLRKPTDLVDTQDLGFVRVHLAPSSFPFPKSRLAPPTVVDAFTAPIVSVSLAPQRRGEPFSFLKPPTDTTGLEDQGRVRVSLARIRPVKTLTFLRPPTVVDAAEAFFGPSVTTVRITPARTQWLLIPPVVETQECYGSVVGFDFAPEVCGDDEGATVVGTTSSDQVSGSDSGATVQGASAAGGSVTGGDEKREGC